MQQLQRFPSSSSLSERMLPLHVKYGNQDPDRFEQVEKGRKMNPRVWCPHQDHDEEDCPLTNALIKVAPPNQTCLEDWTSKAKATKRFNLQPKTNAGQSCNRYRLEARVFDARTKDELFQCPACQQQESPASSCSEERSFLQIRCPELSVVKKGLFRLPISFRCVPSHQSSCENKPPRLLLVDMRLIPEDAERPTFVVSISVQFRTHANSFLASEAESESKPVVKIVKGAKGGARQAARGVAPSNRTSFAPRSKRRRGFSQGVRIKKEKDDYEEEEEDYEEEYEDEDDEDYEEEKRFKKRRRQEGANRPSDARETILQEPTGAQQPSAEDNSGSVSPLRLGLDDVLSLPTLPFVELELKADRLCPVISPPYTRCGWFDQQREGEEVQNFISMLDEDDKRFGLFPVQL